MISQKHLRPKGASAVLLLLSLVFALTLLGCGDDEGGGGGEDTTTAADTDTTGGDQDTASDTQVRDDADTTEPPADTSPEDLGVDTSCDGQTRCTPGGSVETCFGDLWMQTRSCPLGCEDGACIVPTDPGACGNPLPLTLGEVATASTATDYALYTWAQPCTTSYGYQPRGTEVVFALTLTAFSNITFTLSPLDATYFGLYLRGVCDEASSQNPEACDANEQTTAGVILTRTLGPGVHYVIVDDFGADGEGAGEFNLLAESEAVPLCHSQAPHYIDLSGGSATLMGDTAAGASDTTWLEYSCPVEGTQTSGRENIFAFQLADSATVRATATSLEPNDSAMGIYLRSDCDDRYAQTGCGYTAGVMPAVLEATLDAGVHYLFVDDLSGSLDETQTFRLELEVL